jgi:hypothetical protein
MGHKNLIWLGALLLANLLILTGISQVWFDQQDDSLGVLEREGLALPKAKPLRSKESLENFQVVVAKNLFSEDRRGPEAMGERGPGLEDGVLLGTIIVGEERAVLIGQPGPRGQQTVQVLRQGEQWRGFRLLEIAKDEVIFEGDEGKRSLAFPRPKLGQ